MFRQDGVIYRQINRGYTEDYEHLMTSGLYADLIEARLLVPHQEVPLPPPDRAMAYKVIQPEPIRFVSYPYEWSFSQLRDTALALLRVQRRSLRHGMTLKDASAYNMQFLAGNPVLIDTLSFERYREGEPWVAYRQFCQHFLAPLALMSYTDVRLSQLLRLYIDGIPLDLASRLLPGRTRLAVTLLLHIHLHASSQRRHAGKAGATAKPDARLSRAAFGSLLESLQSGVRKLKFRSTGTDWASYYSDLQNYTTEAIEHKKQLVAEFLDRVRPALVWDLGANTGLYSRIASERGACAVSFDIDAGCVDLNYVEAKRRRDTHILPLCMDLTNPSPGIGWASAERMSLLQRGPADLVLALALVHHLAIGNNVPLERIAEFLSQAGRALLIEFVPKADGQVQKMLASRQDIFMDYGEDEFEAAFSQYFIIHSKVNIRDSARTLYMMEGRSHAQE